MRRAIAYCETMKNVTVSLDDETYRRAKLRAREKATSLSALVRGFLHGLGSAETEAEALAGKERVLREAVDSFKGGDRIERDAVHERRGR